LISKNNNLRIRSDRSIPLIIEGEFFSRKKIKDLLLKMRKIKKFYILIEINKKNIT